MKLRLPILWLFFVAEAVFAHHGPPNNASLYEADSLTQIEGRVTDVFWRNPHVRFRMTAPDTSGAVVVWELEFAPGVSGMRRLGIPESFLQVGDDVRVAGHISRGKTHHMTVMNLLLPGGWEYVWGPGGRATRPTLWSENRIETNQQGPDEEQVAAATQTARSVFRVWGGSARDGTLKTPAEDYQHLLTDRGKNLASQYDPVTDNPELRCTTGMPVTMFDPTPLEMVDAGDRIVIRQQEYDIERVIHLQASAENSSVQGSPLGYSQGYWEGEKLVVETSGVEWPYFDSSGTPQSGSASYLETFEFPSSGDRLLYTLTVTDPEIFVQPLTLEGSRPWLPGAEIEPYDCVAVWEE